MSKVTLLNLHIDNMTAEEAIEALDQLIQQNRNAYVVTPNLDHVVQLEEDTAFQNAYNGADLVLTDGKPLVWLSHLMGTPICEKVSGSDLFPALCALAAQKGYAMFFLGAAEGVARTAAEKLMRRFQGLKVVGTYSPPFGFEKSEDEIRKIIEMIRSAEPQILIVALGAPKQEKFIAQYRKELGVPLSLGLGATLDFEAGNVKRAPKWMSDYGMEWLYRIFQDPKRLVKRYWNDAVHIVPIILRYRRK